MIHSNKDKKSIILTVIETFGFILIIVSFLYYWGGGPSAHPTNLLEHFKLFIYRSNFLLAFVETAPLTVFLLSIFGVIYGGKLFLKRKERLELFGFLISLLNLGLSLFLAWLLFGLARGL